MIEYAENEVIFKCENICLSYDKPILNNINFEIKNIVRPNIKQGQVISLIGKSGIGKTQLFRILSGLQKPNSGNVLIGADLHPITLGEVGVIPQNYPLFDHRTVYDNLKIVSKNNEKELIMQYANKFDIINEIYKYPQQLSGGQRQRVSILQQILTGNKFILLDEPFSGLDHIVKSKVIDLLLDITMLDDLYTLIIVSHDIESSVSISDTVLLLNADSNGAYIKEDIDLAAMGLSWRKDIDTDPNFHNIIKHIKTNL